MKNAIIALVVAVFGATSMIYANEPAAPTAAPTTEAAPAPTAEAAPAPEMKTEKKDHKKAGKKAKKAKKGEKPEGHEGHTEGEAAH